MSLLALVGVALGLRIPQLNLRPMHNDEAVNAVKFGSLWEGGGYRYDFNEHHGPSLYYATFAYSKLTGAPGINDFADGRLRAVTVVFGLGLLILLPLLTDGLGKRATLCAGLFTAVSPAMVFYSRYFIHEMLLVFGALLALGAAWRYWRSRKAGWALLAGLGFGVMHTTKETFVISLIAAGCALAVNQAWNRYLDASGVNERAPRLNYFHLAAGLGVWVLVAVLLFSSFMSNGAGLLDSIRTYGPWLKRAEGASPHIHPWYFYLHRLLFFHVLKGPVWTEAVIVILACIGAAAGFMRKHLGGANASLVRFLALYTAALVVGYALISYKTPWCLLNFWQSAILLAGVGVAVLFDRFPRALPRLGLTLALLLAGGHLVWQSIQTNTRFAANPCNPYVYAQTLPDIHRLLTKVNALMEVSPEGNSTRINVMAPDHDYWPLPWYLRRFTRVGWFDQVPLDPYAPVMIVAGRFQAGLDEKKTHVMNEYIHLRPQMTLELYIELELWKAYLAKHPPRIEPE